MAFTIQRVEYFNTTVRDQPGEACSILQILEEMGVNLVAFTAMPVGPNSTQLAIFPKDPIQLAHEARMDGMVLDGPHQVLLVQGDDKLGVLAEIHQKLYDANINVYASNGVADGRGGFGYLIYVKGDDSERAAATLGV